MANENKVSAEVNGSEPFAEARSSAAKRAREVLNYCKLWTEGDMELMHLPPDKKCLKHRISVIAEAINMLDALPPNDRTHRREAAAGDVEMQTRTESAASRSVQ